MMNPFPLVRKMSALEKPPFRTADVFYEWPLTMFTNNVLYMGIEILKVHITRLVF